MYNTKGTLIRGDRGQASPTYRRQAPPLVYVVIKLGASLETGRKGFRIKDWKGRIQEYGLEIGNSKNRIQEYGLEI